MAGLGQSAVDSLLGRLKSVLLGKAQLPGGVRGDVEFIKDEMESMNGLLLHLTEAQHHRNHQVRAMVKQVVGLARDCEDYIDLYVQLQHAGATGPGADKGLLAYLRRILRLLRAFPARHRTATRIRGLKVRAREVGERWLRYGVAAPSPAAAADAYEEDAVADIVQTPQAPAAADDEEEDNWRRALLDGEPPDNETVVHEVADRLIQMLSEELPAAGEGDDEPPPLTALAILGERLVPPIEQIVLAHPSVQSKFRHHITFNARDGVSSFHQWPQLTSDPLRFLIVIAHVDEEMPWDGIVGCPAGSAMIIGTPSDDVAKSCAPYKIFHAQSVQEFFCNKAEMLAGKSPHWDRGRVMSILEECYPNAFAMKMLLHLLYVNPNRTTFVLSKCKQLNKTIAKQMLMFCYKELPSAYGSCLLYLTIFPKDHFIRRATLARRWIAEGLITQRDHIASALDEAKRCFDALVARGFLSPGEISAAGNIKSCTVHHEVREFIDGIATDVNLMDTDLPSDLAHHLSIHNRIGLQASHPNLPLDANGSGIVNFLPSLAASSQWQLLKVLDLEGCKGLKKHHLKSICKILLLKYLSLRNTDVVELPKQIQKLQCLETLDIRQTKIQALATKAIVLAMLKYFLAGRKVSAGNEATRSEDSFSTVHMPLCIQEMKNMEILSHVRVSNSDNELAGIAQLLKLRKFGVVLHGKNAKLNDLFRQIEKLHRCLRSLSIRINQPAGGDTHDEGTKDTPLSPPKFIQILHISGVIGGLPHLIQELHQLAKVTLSETHLGEDAVRILGKLRILRCLRLRYKSYTQGELSFKVEEFPRLKSLVVEGSDVTNISFDAGVAPKLEMIVWSFATMEALSGVNHLPKLKKLELNGDCNPDQVEQLRQVIEEHPNHPDFKHNPHLQRQEAGTLVAASTT